MGIPGKLYLATQTSVTFTRGFIHEEKHSGKIFEELISFFSHLSAFELQGPYTHTFQQCLHTSQQHKPLDIPAFRSRPLLERQGAGDVGKLFLQA